jgi:repressor LexA
LIFAGFSPIFSFTRKEGSVHLTRRQKQILDFVGQHIAREGYAPTIEEIGGHFGLRSLATVHKHLTNLQRKGLIKREWNRSRALELVPSQMAVRAVELPLLGRVAAGTPIEAIESAETVFVPEDMLGRGDTYVLQVKGDSMIEEQIRDGDYVIVENRQEARDGEMVIALIDGENVTLKKLYREPGRRVRLQPANARLDPIYVDADRLQVQGVVIGVLRRY